MPGAKVPISLVEVEGMAVSQEGGGGSNYGTGGYGGTELSDCDPKWKGGSGGLFNYWATLRTMISMEDYILEEVEAVPDTQPE